MFSSHYPQIAMSLYSIIGTADKELTLKKLHKAYKLYESVLEKRQGPFFGGKLLQDMIDNFVVRI